MTRLTTILLTILTVTTFGQTKSIPGLTLYKAKVKSVNTDTTNIAGVTVQADKYIVSSKTFVCTRTGFKPKYKNANIQVAVYHVFDTTCAYLDPIYNHIKDYWKEQEEWSKKYSYSNQLDTTTNLIVVDGDTIYFKHSSYGDFSVLPVNEGFLKTTDQLIPFIQPGHGRIGTYAIYWFNRHLYKIVLLKSTGAGGMGFVGQNMVLTHNGQEFPIEGFATRQLEAIKELLKEENKINCAQQ